MEIKLDSSILDSINQNYKIEPSVLIEMEKRRQNAEGVTSSINDILKNAPTAPPAPSKTDSITDEIINNSNYDYTVKERELKSILDLLSLADASIDKSSEVIVNIDNKIVPLIDEINQAINQVKTAYDTRISVGCRSNLIWKSIGTSIGYSAGVGTGVTFSNYIVIKNPNDEITKNYYGLKYYQKPSNRDYGTNIISEFNGSILVGSKSLTVLSIGGTEGIQINDEITDNLNTPTAFTVGNLPKVVGFGTTSVIGVNTTILGNVSSGSSIIAYTGIGSTSNIFIGNYVINENVFDTTTKVVGFGTIATTIKYYNVGLSSIVSVNLIVPSIILNKVSISSITNGSFGFGTSTTYDSILLDVSSNITVQDSPFTAIRIEEDITQNFDYSNNPSDPVTIGIIDTQRVGVGNEIQIVNNGASPGPTQWKKSIEKPEPSVGAGGVKYYEGQALWPYETIVGYASEGNVYTFPENTIPSYINVSPVGLGSTSPICGSYNSNVTLAETNLQSIMNRNLPEIQRLISASIPLRDYRDSNELKAWSYVQSASYIRSELDRLNTSINSLKNFDYNSL